MSLDTILNNEECIERLIELDETFHVHKHLLEGMCIVKFIQSGDTFEIPLSFIVENSSRLEGYTFRAFDYLL